MATNEASALRTSHDIRTARHLRTFRSCLQATGPVLVHARQQWFARRPHTASGPLQGTGTDATEPRQAEEEIRRLNEQLDQRVRQRTAELTAANRELEAFSYSVSHDLRAPLRAIDGFTSALMEESATQGLSEQGKHYLERVRAACHRMEQLIDDLLNLARLTRAEMCWEHVDLSALARSIAAELGKTDPERPVSFLIAPGLLAHCDAQLMRVVLENLFGNAWKYTSKRAQARIEFGLTDYVDAPTFFVRDDGAGFNMAYADKLFVPFQRLHTEREFDGTGVGLATVRRIIHRHGGRVWAEGAPERGAVFYFTIGAGSYAAPSNA